MAYGVQLGIVQYFAECITKAMETQDNNQSHSDFYNTIRTKVHDWAKSKEGEKSTILEYILLVPDFFFLLTRLIIHEEVGYKDKAKLIFAIGYFISPLDLIPDVIGPIGFADDLVVAAMTINNVMKNVGEDVIQECWPGEGKVLEKIRFVLNAIDLIPSGVLGKIKSFF